MQEKTYSYAPLTSGWRSPLLAASGAVAIIVGLFLIVLLSHQIERQPRQIVRTVDLAIAPPKPPPPPPEQTRELKTPAPPELSPNLSQQTPTLTPLALTLKPAPTQARAGDMLGDMSFSLDIAADVERILRFEDLATAPTPVNRPRINFPDSLSRRGIYEGKVIAEISINSEGKARLIRIVSATHRELEPVAQRLVRQIRFTKPYKNGQVISEVRGEWPILMQAPR